MTRYREILRLKSLGFSDRNIARSCSVSRNTVRRVIDKADELNISWPLDLGMTDGALIGGSLSNERKWLKIK